MATITTSPLDAMFPPSNVGSLAVPLVNAPPCIQNITGFNCFDPAGAGRYVVQMLRNRQSSDPPPDCKHCEPYEVASELPFPLYGVEYVNLLGCGAYRMPRNLKLNLSRNLEYISSGTTLCRRGNVPSEIFMVRMYRHLPYCARVLIRRIRKRRRMRAKRWEDSVRTQG
jgi:hypothetical protein